jgi:hypothetical protein
MRFNKQQVAEATNKARNRFIVTRRLSFIFGVLVGFGGLYTYQNWEEIKEQIQDILPERKGHITVIKTPFIVVK